MTDLMQEFEQPYEWQSELFLVLQWKYFGINEMKVHVELCAILHGVIRDVGNVFCRDKTA